ncbi:hypothetical protein ACX3PU_02910 [Chryseobacterium sp. A301]
MKTILNFLVIALICLSQGLAAQMFYFEAIEFAGPPDAEGRHKFEQTHIKVILDGEKKEISAIDPVTNLVISQYSFDNDARAEEKSDYTQYIFTDKTKESITVEDYTDPNGTDHMKFFDSTGETLHLKGIFTIIYLKPE